MDIFNRKVSLLSPYRYLYLLLLADHTNKMVWQIMLHFPFRDVDLQKKMSWVFGHVCSRHKPKPN